MAERLHHGICDLKVRKQDLSILSTGKLPLMCLMAILGADWFMWQKLRPITPDHFLAVRCSRNSSSGSAIPLAKYRLSPLHADNFGYRRQDGHVRMVKFSDGWNMSLSVKHDPSFVQTQKENLIKVLGEDRTQLRTGISHRSS
ncbi:hypothetical protein AV530_018745 [Patagioenas fasciata monilis]|uniref:Uncharacterized protein n=1 Tax=Patagioenas fasciata monilis TaxID=372326 RepID=A0A1V4JJE4_PATFA|nr:hypothetical protein AV530_018745 [Patagioenas fasciata monilis]